MADRKISDLTALTTPAAGDYLPIIDISESLAANKNKRITIEELLRGAPDGTAGAPGIGFEGDPNTGIYRPGADQLALATAGAGRLFVDASGNVGVGAAPSNTFDVTAASNPTASIRTTAAATSASILKLEGYRTSGDTGRLGEISVINTRDGDEQASIEITADGDTEGKFTFKSSTNSLCEFGNTFTRFFSSNTERLRITSAGLVGIGTSAPSARTQIGSSGAFSTASSTYTGDAILLEATSSAGTSGTYGQGIVWSRNTSAATRSAAIASVQTGADTDQVGLAFFTHPSTNVADPLVEAARIDSSGRVGIGTASPAGALNVQSSASDTWSAEGNGLVINGGNVGNAISTITTYYDDSSIRIGSGVSQKTGILITGQTSGSGSTIQLRTGNSERARIDSSGRLLVGTSSARSNFGGSSAFRAQIEGDSFANSGLSITRNSNDNGTPSLCLAKSRSTGNTVVISGDSLGTVFFEGNDGSNFVRAAQITAQVDGTPGANDMPGRLVFSTTADGASSPTERLRITSAGLVGIGTASPLFPLDVNGVIYTRGRGSTFGVLFDDWRIYNSTAPGALVFDNGSERARIDSSGRLLVGTSTAVENVAGGFQLNGGSAVINTFIANSAAYRLSFVKSRSGTFNGKAIVQSGDDLGMISFYGDDGVDYGNEAASITAQVDGTPGANDMPGRLVFSTTADGASSPTERMRIGQNGYFKASTNGTYNSTDVHNFYQSNTNAFGLIVGGYGSYTSTVFVLQGTNATSTAFNLIEGYYGGNQTTGSGGSIAIRVRGDGDITNLNNSYGAISDIKLKENIVNANSQWDDIKTLQVRNYNLKEGQTHTQIGLIAQEVELVSPGLVSESPDRDEDGNDLGTVTKSVNYSVLYMKAVKALQEAMERIETLEAKVAALEGA